MNRYILEFLVIIGFFCAYAQGFIAPDGIRDYRKSRLIQVHDQNRTAIGKNKKTTDIQKAAALEVENRNFTAKMVELQHLQAVGKPCPKCTNRGPYFFSCKNR